MGGAKDRRPRPTSLPSGTAALKKPGSACRGQHPESSCRPTMSSAEAATPWKARLLMHSLHMSKSVWQFVTKNKEREKKEGKEGRKTFTKRKNDREKREERKKK